MTARDDLVNILGAIQVPAFANDMPYPHLALGRAETIVDAIPDVLLVRLAIERGTLQPATVYDAEHLARKVTP